MTIWFSIKYSKPTELFQLFFERIWTFSFKLWVWHTNQLCYKEWLTKSLKNSVNYEDRFFGVIKMTSPIWIKWNKKKKKTSNDVKEAPLSTNTICLREDNSKPQSPKTHKCVATKENVYVYNINKIIFVKKDNFMSDRTS